MHSPVLLVIRKHDKVCDEVPSNHEYLLIDDAEVICERTTKCATSSSRKCVPTEQRRRKEYSKRHWSRRQLSRRTGWVKQIRKNATQL